MVLSVISCTYVFAGGFEGPGLGANAISKGGAFIGQADDWSAIYYNPAGLTQLDGRGVGFSLFNNNTTMYDGNSVKNFDNPLTDPNPESLYDPYQNDIFFRVYHNYDPGAGIIANEPNKFNKRDTKIKAYNPGLGGYCPVKNWTFGYGVYVPIGNSRDWDDTVKDTINNADIYAKFHTLFYNAILNFSAARQINERLSLGFGINYVDMKLETEIFKNYSGAGPLDYSIRTLMDGKGSNFEEVFGVLYKVSENTQIGTVYRTGTIIKLKGPASVTPTGALLASLNNESSDFTQRFPMPATLGIGLSYKVSKKLITNIDYNWTEWSVMKNDIHYASPGVMLNDVNLKSDWNNSSRYKIGFEYNYNPKLNLRGGLLYDQQCLPDKGYSITNLTGPDLISYNLGAAYLINENFTTDVSLSYMKSSKTINNVKYSMKDISIVIGAKYNF